MTALAVAAPAHATLYKWTDAQGKVHYTDQPPNVNAQSLKGAAQGPAQATESLEARNQAYEKRRKETEEARAKAEKEAEQARAKRENCDKARANLETLQNKPRVFRSDSAGQRVYMDDAARANALAESRKAVSEFCK